MTRDSYSAFCERYRQWAQRLQRSMRQRHYAGEKVFVDYAGRTVPIYGASCEEAFRATLFVGALGASGYAYAEATRTASLPDWLGSHVRMLEFYGAAPTILVPDNLRVGLPRRTATSRNCSVRTRRWPPILGSR